MRGLFNRDGSTISNLVAKNKFIKIIITFCISCFKARIECPCARELKLVGVLCIKSGGAQVAASRLVICKEKPDAAVLSFKSMIKCQQVSSEGARNRRPLNTVVGGETCTCISPGKGRIEKNRCCIKLCHLKCLSKAGIGDKI